MSNLSPNELEKLYPGFSKLSPEEQKKALAALDQVEAEGHSANYDRIIQLEEHTKKEIHEAMMDYAHFRLKATDIKQVPPGQHREYAERLADRYFTKIQEKNPNITRAELVSYFEAQIQDSFKLADELAEFDQFDPNDPWRKRR